MQYAPQLQELCCWLQRSQMGAVTEAGVGNNQDHLFSPLFVERV